MKQRLLVLLPLILLLLVATPTMAQDLSGLWVGSSLGQTAVLWVEPTPDGKIVWQVSHKETTFGGALITANLVGPGLGIACRDTRFTSCFLAPIMDLHTLRLLPGLGGQINFNASYAVFTGAGVSIGYDKLFQ